MIVLFTDFGLDGPYTGQMKAVLHRETPDATVVDLFADAPAGNPKAAAYLLAAYAAWFPAGTVFLCVVDPGVGGARPAVVVEADGRRYVGPGNGLFELVQRRAAAEQRALVAKMEEAQQHTLSRLEAEQIEATRYYAEAQERAEFEEYDAATKEERFQAWRAARSGGARLAAFNMRSLSTSGCARARPAR